jgi:O-methyltransferase involved in polyketide biosynthesis
MPAVYRPVRAAIRRRGHTTRLAAAAEVHARSNSGNRGLCRVQDLWYLEDRTDVSDWLTEHNWEVSAVESIDLMTRYGRWTPGQDDAGAPRTVFVEGRLVC